MNIEYKVIKSKRKSMAICVKPDGAVIVRVPLKIAKADIAQFVAKYSNWIQEQISKVSACSGNNNYYYLGKAYILKPKATINSMVFEEGYLVTNFMPEQIKSWYYSETRQLVQPFIDEYCQRFKLKYSAIKVSSARKRWGSCSIQGNISFSYRVAMLPKTVIQYIVAHELAHLKHHNHSKAYWVYVEQLYPEYKDAHKWLKKHQDALTYSLL